MRAYPVELRERVVAAVADGCAPAEVAAHYEIAVASVYRYVARQRGVGTLIPLKPPGRPRAIPAAAEAALAAQVAAAADAFLHEHCAQWAERGGARVSVATMQRALARVAMTRKKRPSAPVNRTG